MNRTTSLQNNFNWTKMAVSFFTAVFLIASLVQPQGSARAAAVLTVTPVTWNVIGLDSNNVDVGPNNFPVGVRVCNTGSEATNVNATFNWDDGQNKFTGNDYINLRSGSYDTYALSSLAAGSVLNPTCHDFYFEVTFPVIPFQGLHMIRHAVTISQ